MPKIKTLGIAYHSPLDVHAILPAGLTCALDVNVKSDIFFTKEPQKNISKIQLVFDSQENLKSQKIKIIDQCRGCKITLTTDEIRKYLGGWR